MNIDLREGIALYRQCGQGAGSFPSFCVFVREILYKYHRLVPPVKLAFLEEWDKKHDKRETPSQKIHLTENRK